jgi:hypothetical protein
MLPFVGDTKVDLILVSFSFLVQELCGFYWSNKIFLVPLYYMVLILNFKHVTIIFG